MKTPEPSIPLESFMYPKKTEPEEIAAQVVGRYMPTSKAESPRGYYLANDVSDVVAAERAKADALAGALRQADDMIANCGGVPNNPDGLLRMLQAHFRAALAAYDAEAK